MEFLAQLPGTLSTLVPLFWPLYIGAYIYIIVQSFRRRTKWRQFKARINLRKTYSSPARWIQDSFDEATPSTRVRYLLRFGLRVLLWEISSRVGGRSIWGDRYYSPDVSPYPTNRPLLAAATVKVQGVDRAVDT